MGDVDIEAKRERGEEKEKRRAESCLCFWCLCGCHSVGQWVSVCYSKYSNISSQVKKRGKTERGKKDCATNIREKKTHMKRRRRRRDTVIFEGKEDERRAFIDLSIRRGTKQQRGLLAIPRRKRGRGRGGGREREGGTATAVKHNNNCKEQQGVV